ncbi:hypothetical protein OPV22_029051 [Ensete ventricosum]|uniref:Uncharacterized protein n=1 Tax=Ensete ventricosum TaxID=4639 RepID=A0AAV8Q4R7_ENSVE|nr:hypothetical protein OPV22_029051 [Ensete ventricosum]
MVKISSSLVGVLNFQILSSSPSRSLASPYGYASTSPRNASGSSNCFHVSILLCIYLFLHFLLNVTNTSGRRFRGRDTRSISWGTTRTGCKRGWGDRNNWRVIHGF